MKQKLGMIKWVDFRCFRTSRTFCALWHNFLDEMKMLDLCSNFEGTFPVMAVHGCHQTI